MRMQWFLRRGSVLAVPLAVALGMAARGSNAQAPAAPTLKTVPCESIASVDGKDSYMAYCAVCHGVGAKGNGPAVPALRTPVPDLTTLARRQGGKYNVMAVQDAISGRGKVPPAHGEPTMLMWGPVFRSADSDQARNTMRIHNLAKYIETLQQPH